MCGSSPPSWTLRTHSFFRPAVLRLLPLRNTNPQAVLGPACRELIDERQTRDAETDTQTLHVIHDAARHDACHIYGSSVPRQDRQSATLSPSPSKPIPTVRALFFFPSRRCYFKSSASGGSIARHAWSRRSTFASYRNSLAAAHSIPIPIPPPRCVHSCSALQCFTVLYMAYMY